MDIDEAVRKCLEQTKRWEQQRERTSRQEHIQLLIGRIIEIEDGIVHLPALKRELARLQKLEAEDNTNRSPA